DHAAHDVDRVARHDEQAHGEEDGEHRHDHRRHNDHEFAEEEKHEQENDHHRERRRNRHLDEHLDTEGVFGYGQAGDMEFVVAFEGGNLFGQVSGDGVAEVFRGYRDVERNRFAVFGD